MTSNGLIRTLALSGLLAISSPLLAETSQNPMPEMGEKLARLGGQMHVAAKKCGGYTEEQLEQMKAEQRKVSANFAMSEEDFDKAFSAGENLIEARWKTMSSEERSAACEELKQLPPTP